MAANQEALALERQQRPDEFLALIEKVVLNPEVDAEKLKVIVGLKLQLEDRAAEKAFDAAMQEAQKEVQALKWDKLNPEKNSRYVSYPKIDAMLKPVREKFGFSECFGVEPEMPAPNLMMMYSDVTYKGPEGTHRRRFHLPMSISGEGPKGGGVMSAAQAVGNGSSLGMRYLEKLIWKIPMLVDKDDNDGNPVKRTITAEQVAQLQPMFDKLSDLRKKKFFEVYKISALDELPPNRFAEVFRKLSKIAEEGATINEKQEATLTQLIDEIGGSCKADFLRDNRIKFLSELRADQYAGALEALQVQRRQGKGSVKVNNAHESKS